MMAKPLPLQVDDKEDKDWVKFVTKQQITAALLAKKK